MGRLSRSQVLFDGCYVHIISRFSDKRYAFKDSDDFEMFRKLLLTSKDKGSFQIHHYCLMNTHFHLVASILNTDAFIQALGWLKVSYAKYFNLKYKRFGPLWRDRFKSLLIEDESYLYACGLYVEYNPVEAGMVAKPEDWPYSSSAHYFSGKKDPLLDAYEQKPLPPNVDLSNEKFFAKGSAIGSQFFQMQVREGGFRAVPVP